MAIRSELLPGTATAMKIRKMIRENIELSQRAIGQKYRLWDDLEGSYRAWRLMDEEDDESSQKSGVTKIVVPIQFATVQIMLTFLMEVFTSLPPVLKVTGAEPSTRKTSKVMELALDYDYRGNRGYFLLNQWFFNILRYGYGIIANDWSVKQILRKQLIESPSSRVTIAGQSFSVPGPMKLDYGYLTTFEGNQWRIVDNREFFPDPRWPLSRFQEGNFVAERDLIHDHDMADLERQGIFFNTERIKSSSGYGSTRGSENDRSSSHNRDDYSYRYSLENVLMEAKKNKMHLNESIIVKIIPRDYNLDTENRAIDYVFNLIDDTYIVRAEPSTFMPRFPYSVSECYPDILAFMSQGVMQLTQPLADHMNFLFNSHMSNVRKAVNDRFLIDPTKVNIEDFMDPDNILIRLLPSAYGTNVAEYMQQLNVVDITRGHAQDIASIREFWEVITGASPHMFGQISSGRRTAFELQGVFRQAGARMKMTADLIAACGIAPLTEQMALMRQQNMTQDQFIAISGQTAADLGVDFERDIHDNFFKVRPSHLDGVFAFPAELGALPQDRAAASEILDKMFQTVAANPYLTQVFDPVEIFKEELRQGGLKNLDDFMQRGIRAQTMIMTPDQLAELYAKNKLAPTNIATNGNQDRSQPLTLNGAMNGAGSARQPA